MEIINIMEKEVLRIINDICEEQVQSGNERYCITPLCKLDAACYVLNRIPPRYITSSRGMAHVEQDYNRNRQLEVDIVRLAAEALQRVTTIQRSYYNAPYSGTGESRGPHFNFPTVSGRILNGVSFEPVYGVSVSLLMENETTRMMDSRWQNPYRIDAATPGTFIFWPDSIPANEAKEVREFEFEISAEGDGYAPFHHYFSITVTADQDKLSTLRFSEDHDLGDMYIVNE
jgi:competence protein ComFB